MYAQMYGELREENLGGKGLQLKDYRELLSDSPQWTPNIWDKSQSIQKIYFAKVKDTPMTQPQEVLTTRAQGGRDTA